MKFHLIGTKANGQPVDTFASGPDRNSVLNKAMMSGIRIASCDEVSEHPPVEQQSAYQIAAPFEMDWKKLKRTVELGVCWGVIRALVVLTLIWIAIGLVIGMLGLLPMIFKR